MRNDEEEAKDREEEAKTWREWDGKTDCFGTVAKMIILCLIVVKAIVESV